VADGWCWFVLREEYCWLVAGGWFVLREKYCWLVADKPSEQGVRNHMTCGSNESDRFEQNPREIHIECLIWTLDEKYRRDITSEVMHLRPSALAHWVTSWRKATKDFVLQRSTEPHGENKDASRIL
jgi:hypothetical protein